MKYYKGYPEVMGIDGCTVTLHDIERTMLSLYWDNFVCEPDKTWLLDKYKEERMDYLDGIFCFDDAIRSRLEEVERLWMNARQRMAGRIRRMAASEQEKARRSEKHASLLRAHIEVGNLEDTDGLVIVTMSVICGIYCLAKTDTVGPIGDSCAKAFTSMKRKTRRGYFPASAPCLAAKAA